MQRRRTGRSAAPILCALAVAGCGAAAPVAPVTYHVVYQLFVNASDVFADSIKYDDGHGTLVKVVAPAVDWSTSVTVAAGGSVQAEAWLFTEVPVSTKLVATWTNAGVSTAADSGIAVASAKGKLSVALPHHTL